MRQEIVDNCIRNPGSILLINQDRNMRISTQESWKGLDFRLLKVRQPAVFEDKNIFAVPHSPLSSL